MRIPAATWPRPSNVSDASELPGEHRRVETLRCDRCAVFVGGREPEGGIPARALCYRGSVHRPQFRAREEFFGDGLVAHVSMAHPVCSRLGEALYAAASSLSLPVTRGGTYLVMEGPQFSTKAESELYRSWGCSVIGMTNMPEAKLAREAELCYATVAMVTDFDCWHPDHDHVTVEAVVRILLGNADKARDLVRAIVPNVGQARGLCPCGCDRALDNALITAADRRDKALAASWMRWRDGCCSYFSVVSAVFGRRLVAWLPRPPH